MSVGLLERDRRSSAAIISDLCQTLPFTLPLPSREGEDEMGKAGHLAGVRP
jgi:hypothetical protein